MKSIYSIYLSIYLSSIYLSRYVQIMSSLSIKIVSFFMVVAQ